MATTKHSIPTTTTSGITVRRSGGTSRAIRLGLRGGLNTYAYVYDSPLAYSDPLGLDGFMQPAPPVRYNNPPAPRETRPVDPRTEMQMQCMMLCLGTGTDPAIPHWVVPQELTITGGGESRGHSVTSLHPSGQAIDFGQGANPSLSPAMRPKREVLECACKCEFTHGGWEQDWNPRTTPHYHFQNGAGARVPALNCNGCVQ